MGRLSRVTWSNDRSFIEELL